MTLASFTPAPVQAQALTVLPVNIALGPGQRAASLTVINESDSETSIQVRGFAWDQNDGTDQLKESGDITISPPIATIKPRARQIVRFVLHSGPRQREASYRILLDQIPPPSTPGTVRLTLRLSIPVFASPTGQLAPKLVSYVELGTAQGPASLVIRNDGTRHETVRDMSLTSADGKEIGFVGGASHYILAGATRRWTITFQTPPVPGSMVHLKARGDANIIDQQLVVKPHP